MHGNLIYKEGTYCKVGTQLHVMGLKDCCMCHPSYDNRDCSKGNVDIRLHLNVVRRQRLCSTLPLHLALMVVDLINLECFYCPVMVSWTMNWMLINCDSDLQFKVKNSNCDFNRTAFTSTTEGGKMRETKLYHQDFTTAPDSKFHAENSWSRVIG